MIMMVIVVVMTSFVLFMIMIYLVRDMGRHGHARCARVILCVWMAKNDVVRLLGIGFSRVGK